MTTVYIDILFIENFFLDFFVLYITAFALGRRFSFMRASIASLVGAFYTCSLYISKFDFFENIIFKIMIMAFMLFIVFKIREVYDLIKCMLTFVFMNIILGGSIFLVNSSFFSEKEGIFHIKPRYFGVIIGLFLILIFGNLIVVLVKKSMEQSLSKKELTLVYKNKKISLNTFSDTGNTLIDPITKSSVVVVSRDKLKNLIDEENISEIKNFRLIPCKTVTDKYELLYGFKPDKFLYNNKEINAVVAISKTEFDGEYDAIINPLTLI